MIVPLVDYCSCWELQRSKELVESQSLFKTTQKNSGRCSFSKVIMQYLERMSRQPAFQIMSLPIVPTYPSLFMDNIWSINSKYDMPTKWICTQAKISMNVKVDWTHCFKRGLFLLRTQTQTQRPILRSDFSHTWPPCLSSASWPPLEW